MNANQIIDALLAIEHSRGTAPDERRVIRDARQSVQVAAANIGKSNAQLYRANFPARAQEIQRQADIDTAVALDDTIDNARRIARSWGHDI